MSDDDRAASPLSVAAAGAATGAAPLPATGAVSITGGSCADDAASNSKKEVVMRMREGLVPRDETGRGGGILFDV